MNILGDKIILRAVELDDLEILREMMNDPYIESKVGGWSFPVSKRDQEEWYNKNQSNVKNIKLVIEIKGGEVIGLANIDNIDWKNRTAFHGMKLKNENYRGKGYGTDVVMTIMRYVFEELQLNRLDGSWLSSNEASENLYLKCGWKIEGIKRQAIFKNNVYHDQKQVGILKEEYEQVKRLFNERNR